MTGTYPEPGPLRRRAARCPGAPGAPRGGRDCPGSSV